MKRYISFTILIFFGLNFTCYSQVEDYQEVAFCKIFFDSGNLTEALYCFQQHESNIFAKYYIAKISYLQNNIKTYKKLKKSLISKNNRSEQSYLLYALLYPANSRSYEKALNKGLRKYPNDTILLLSKINLLIDIENYNKIIPYADRLIKHSNNPRKEYYHVRAFTFQKNGNNSLAIENYQNAIELDSLFVDAHYNLGSVYFNMAADLIENNYDTNINKYASEIVPLIDEYMKKSYTHLKTVDRLSNETEVDENLQRTLQKINEYFSTKK